MKRRPRPQLLTPAARELVTHIAISVAGAGFLLAVRQLLAAHPFLIGG